MLDRTSEAYQNVLKKKTKFASFMSSATHAQTNVREAFFNTLNEHYKHVDSGGIVMNNIGHSVADKMKWLESYKFNIAFENKH
jgi:hypothetical protein